MTRAGRAPAAQVARLEGTPVLGGCACCAAAAGKNACEEGQGAKRSRKLQIMTGAW
jgi:hypothetical protein